MCYGLKGIHTKANKNLEFLVAQNEIENSVFFAEVVIKHFFITLRRIFQFWLKATNAGAAEPNAQGCAFALPIFGLIVNKMVVLRTQHFGLNYKMCAQY